MRNFMRVMVVAGILAASVAARAQIIDPNTGIMVAAASDPTDFAAVASGQPGNFALEAATQAMDQSQAAAQAAEADMQAFRDSISAAANDDANTAGDDAPGPTVFPVTETPKIVPAGGKVAAGTEVAITDTDAGAIVFYTTDGTKPTTSSERYNGPFVVNAKEKVEALALDVSLQPSGVVAKTFTVKK